MLQRRTHRSGVLLVSAGIASVAFSFLRNIAIARIVGVEQFGLAAVIATVAAAIDIMGDLGWDKFMIQRGASDDDERALASIHLLKFCSGAGFSLLILALAWPLAQAVQASALAPALALLSLSSLLRAGLNVDYKLAQRRFDYNGEAIVEAGRFAADLIVGVAVAVIFQSFWAMFWAVFANHATSFALGHLLAKRRYRWGWDPVIGGAALAFGLPLLLNHAIVYVAGQGDRLLVAIGLDTRILAVYAAALTVSAGAQAVVSRTLSSIGIPLLAQARADPVKYRTRFAHLGWAIALVNAMLLVGLALLGADLIALVFGPAFRPPSGLLVALAITQACNSFRLWGMTGLMAHAETRSIPRSNLVRLAGIGLAAVVVQLGGSMVDIAWSLAFGEALGALSSLLWHRRVSGAPLGPAIRTLSAFAVLGAAASALAEWAPESLGVRLVAALTICGLLAIVAAAVIGSRRRGASQLPGEQA